MANTWDEIAHTTLENATEPITADATNVAKYGAPSVAVVTAILTAILGASWKVDPSQPAVVFSVAIIVAAVVLGIYFAFASDIRTRGAVAIARYEAITKLAAATGPPATNGTVPSLTAALTATKAQLDAANVQVQGLGKELQATKTERDTAASQLQSTKTELAVAQAHIDDLVKQTDGSKEGT